MLLNHKGRKILFHYLMSQGQVFLKLISQTIFRHCERSEAILHTIYSLLIVARIASSQLALLAMTETRR